MKGFLKIILCCLLLLCFLFASAAVAGNGAREFVSQISNGGAGAFRVGIQMNTLLPYGQETLNDLNRLVRHFSLTVLPGEDRNTCGISLDGQELFCVEISEENGGTGTVFSFQPDTVYLNLTENAAGGELYQPPSPALLSDGEMDLTDEIFKVLARMPEMYPEQTKVFNVNTKFRELGTSTVKDVITFTKPEADEGILNAFLEALPEGTAERIGILVFSARQQITLYYDAEGALLKAIWSGQGGPEAGKQSKIYVEWVRTVSNVRTMEKISVKLNATKGSDRRQIEIDHEETQAENNPQTLSWTCTDTLVENRVKTVTESMLSLQTEGQGCRGVISGAVKIGKDTEEGTSLDLNLKKDLTGTARFETRRNGVTLSDFTFTIEKADQAATEKTGPAKTADFASMTEEERAEAWNGLKRKIAVCMIGSVLALPEEDLAFLTKDIDTDGWKRLSVE